MEMCMIFKSIDFNSVDKFDVLNIHKYLMTNNKVTFSLIKQVFIALFTFNSYLVHVAKIQTDLCY